MAQTNHTGETGERKPSDVGVKGFPNPSDIKIVNGIATDSTVRAVLETMGFEIDQYGRALPAKHKEAEANRLRSAIFDCEAPLREVIAMVDGMAALAMVTEPDNIPHDRNGSLYNLTFMVRNHLRTIQDAILPDDDRAGHGEGGK